MQISDRLAKIRPSMTLTINARAQELRAQGKQVVSLAVGETDFPTPRFIKDAAIKAIEDNFTRYTPVAGMPELRKAAGNYFNRYYQTPIAPENIIIGAGGKQCLYTFIQTFINPGDEVIIPAPYWVSYPDMVLLAGGRPVTPCAGPETNYKITPQMLEQAATPNTVLLIVNSPCNPTGAVYTKDELAGIVEWAVNRGIFVLSDEIYDQLVYPPAVPASAISWFLQYPEQVAIANGLSKTYAMTGWRMGFLAAHEEIIKKMTLLQGHSLSNATSITQKAALAGLEGPDDSVKEMRQAFEKRRDLAMELVKSWKRAVCPRPDGAFYIFVDLSAYYTKSVPDSIALCSHILEKALVATVPGAAFGDDKCVRLSYAIDEGRLVEALTKIGACLEQIPE